MKEKELRDEVLLAIYNRRDNLNNIGSKELCTSTNINFDNDSQRKRIFKTLNDDAYIEATFIISGDCYIRSITSKGIDYVEKSILVHANNIESTVSDNNNSINWDISKEENLASEVEERSRQIMLENTNKQPDEEKIKELILDIQKSIDIYSDRLRTSRSQKTAITKQLNAEKNKGKNRNENAINDYDNSLTQIDDFIKKVQRLDKRVKTILESVKQITPQNYLKAEKIDKVYTDKNTAPCFQIDIHSSAFIDLLDSFQERDSQMIGIFGGWGRGKTYFYNYIKEKLTSKNAKDGSNHKKYYFVEFNAWKYQEAPAIWAYLFETMFKSYGCCFKRFLYTLWRRCPSWRNIVIFTFSVLLGWVLYCLITTKFPLTIASEIKDVFEKFGIPLAWLITIVSVFRNFIDNPLSSYKLIKKYTKDISFNNELGIQSEIEKELESLLKCWIKKNNKVVLFIDDIDRCSEHKIISIIDSLRTILENPEIRKRLIVICAVDDIKLIRAIKYKYRDLYNDKSESNNDEQLNKLAREQMDKLFLSGIKLKSINNEEKIEFLDELILHKKETIIERPLNDENRDVDVKSTTHNEALQTKDNSQKEYYGKISDEKILDILKKISIEYPKEITPRQLRIIYYRFIFANNILQGSNIYVDKIMKDIFLKSLGEKSPLDDKDIKTYLDVIETVVCY